MKQLVLDQVQGIGIYSTKKSYPPDTVPLVLVHGFCEDSSLWDPLLPGLSELPVIAIDLPGFGQSALAPQPSMEAYATSIVNVLDALKIERCVLIGHSLGGYVALEFAALYGHRLAGMGLFHSHPFPDNAERKTVRLRGIEMIRAGKRDLYVAQLFPNLFTQAFVQSNPEVLQALIERGQQQSPEAIMAAIQVMMDRRDHQNTLSKMTCPVLFLLGLADSLVPLDQAWQAAMLPNISMVQVLNDVAHMGMFEAPESCVVGVLEFYGLVAG